MKIYRSRKGRIFGVCKGLEESLGFPAKYSRVILVVLAVLFNGWYILGAYLLTSLLMPLESREKPSTFRENFEVLRKDAFRFTEKELRDLRRYTSKEESPESNG